MFYEYIIIWIVQIKIIFGSASIKFLDTSIKSFFPCFFISYLKSIIHTTLIELIL